MPRPLGAFDPAKRAAILEAARLAFREHGFCASMDDIAQRAHVAKQTVYNHFGSKAELVHALVEQISAALAADLVPGDAEAVEQTLTRFGRTFLAHLLDPGTIRLHRLVLTQAMDFPGLAADIYEFGPRRSRDRLADYLGRESAAGRLSVPDPAAAAEIFFGMLTGHRLICAMMKSASCLSGEEIAQRVDECVRVFLAGYRTTAIS